METIVQDEILIDIGGSNMPLLEVITRIEQYRLDPMYKDREIFLDGDRNAIVARLKVK
ncbi:MAG: hypothetical protein MJZ68_00005 [archaeon]|nr:hypothetical protein [archaeon]